jgi:hypothetical protein
MVERSAQYENLKIKKNTLKIIQGFFKTDDPEAAIEELARWLKERKSENDLMRKYQGKGRFKKSYGQDHS